MANFQFLPTVESTRRPELVRLLPKKRSPPMCKPATNWHKLAASASRGSIRKRPADVCHGGYNKFRHSAQAKPQGWLCGDVRSEAGREKTLTPGSTEGAPSLLAAKAAGAPPLLAAKVAVAPPLLAAKGKPAGMLPLLVAMMELEPAGTLPLLAEVEATHSPPTVEEVAPAVFPKKCTLFCSSSSPYSSGEVKVSGVLLSQNQANDLFTPRSSRAEVSELTIASCGIPIEDQQRTARM
ncbi:UNVERIFIED_CONTAM: hypothetical protein FKN15_023078 [Acipenser sinensis]